MSTRKPRVMALMLAMVMALLQFGFVAQATNGTSSLSDVKNHYAEDQIQKWIAEGFILGYPDGTFKPEKEVTRAEFVTLLNRAFKLTKVGTIVKTFSDVTEKDWFYNDVTIATSNGILEGYPDGTFKPGIPISRQDAGVIISRYLAIYGLSDPDNYDGITDKSAVSDYAVEHIKALAELGILTLKSGGLLNPKDNITRADTVVWMDNAYVLVAGGSGIAGKIYLGNKALANAGITLSKKGEHKPAEVLETDANGLYSAGLEPGIYDIVVIKGNYVAYKSEIVVDGDFKIYTKLAVQQGKPVAATVKDINGDNLGDADIYFKTDTGAYIKATSDEKGKISIVLPSGKGYEIYYEKDGEMINAGKFTATGNLGTTFAYGNIKTLLGTEKDKKPTDDPTQKPPTSTDPVTPPPSGGGGGGDSGGGGGIQESKIIFNTSSFKALDKVGSIFMVSDKLDTLSGSVTGGVDIAHISLRITVGNLELVNGDIPPSKNWSYSNPSL